MKRKKGGSDEGLPNREVNMMVNTVFEYIYSIFICLCMIEVAAVLFVSVHETFSEKRKQMKEYYKNKRKGGGAK